MQATSLNPKRGRESHLNSGEEPPVVTVIGRPPILRVGHQRIKVLLQSFQIKFQEFISVVKLLAPSDWTRGMLVQNIQVQLGPNQSWFDVPRAPEVIIGLFFSVILKITLPQIVFLSKFYKSFANVYYFS
jgi:hypothetical protein